MEEYKYDRQYEDFQDALPMPLAQHMFHCLTSKRCSSSQEALYAQRESVLFSRLPAEVRLVIWEHAIGRQKIHIICKYRRFGHAVCNAEYWTECRSKMPGIRASSYMFTYGSLPTTRQLADWSMCNLLVVCRRIYDEAVSLLYRSNTFVFWDLRIITAFRDSISPDRWQAIRSIEIYAMCYRKEDMDEAINVRSRLQLKAWPSSCVALEKLTQLRHLRIIIANPFYLDWKHLQGRQAETRTSIYKFLGGLKGLDVRCEIFWVAREGDEHEGSLWDLRGVENKVRASIESVLREHGLKYVMYMGDIWPTEAEVEHRTKMCEQEQARA